MGASSADLTELAQRGYRFALSLTHHVPRAEDLVQDAWLSLLRSNGPWTRAFLFTVIRNRFIDLCRRERCVTFESLSDSAEAVADDGESCWPNDTPLAISNESLEKMSVRAEGQRRHSVVMLHPGHFLSRGRLPHPRCAVVACRGQALSVRAEGHRPHIVRRAFP